MLTAPRLAVAISGLLLGLLSTSPAWAASPSPGPGTNCPPDVYDCSVHSGGSSPGSQGSPSRGGGGASQSGGGPATCTLAGQQVPCQRSDGSWFNSSDGCYWKQESNPNPSDPAWNGHKPGDGALYDVTCPNTPGVNNQLQGGTVWSANPPPGFGGGPNLAALAQQAVTAMKLLGPDVGMAPDPNGKGGTVGVPVWMWNKHSAQTTGPTSASATALGVTVTATAIVQKVDWQMGDGHTVTCNGPGTAYSASDGMAKSPDCGYLYTATSAQQPGGKYQITATTTWAVHWAGGGQQGDLTTTRTSQVQIPVGELQVVGG